MSSPWAPGPSTLECRATIQRALAVLQMPGVVRPARDRRLPRRLAEPRFFSQPLMNPAPVGVNCQTDAIVPIPSRGRAVVRAKVRIADGAAAARLAGHPVGRAHADCRADRLGQ